MVSGVSFSVEKFEDRLCAYVFLCRKETVNLYNYKEVNHTGRLGSTTCLVTFSVYFCNCISNIYIYHLFARYSN